MANFNADQLKAIEAQNHTILVSAAAGSGKTTVMVEKIKQSLINHPEKHLSNMLVITFTREAASNMRRKLQDLLLAAADDATLTEAQQCAASAALDEIENAQISTIHAFCIQVIRSGFHILDVDPLVRVGEESEIAPMFDAAFEKTMNLLLEPESAAAIPGMTPVQHANILTLFGAFTSEELLLFCKNLYGALMGIPDPFDRLHELINAIDLPLEIQPWAIEIMSAVRMDLYGLASLVEREQDIAEKLPAYPAVSDIAAADRDVITSFLDSVQTADSVENLYKSVSDAIGQMQKLKSLRGLSDEDKQIYEAFKNVRGMIKGKDSILGQAAADLGEVLNTAQIRDNQKIQSELQGLEVLIRLVSEAFRAEKQAANVIDFSDMEQMTYRLMTDTEHPEIRENLRTTYSDIYVDESQDISAIQNAIIQAMHHSDNRLFMVGDVKQSIYRFRHAEPRLFMHLRDTYSMEDDAESRKIYFQDNYRSSINVIACVNEVFSMAMDRQVNELDYEEGDYLIANKEGTFGETEIILLNLDPAEKLNAQAQLEAQCMAVARRIEALLADVDGEKIEPPYQYRDIAILLRSAKADAPRMVEIFKQLHVPIYYDGAMNYYGLSEVAMFLSLLSTIDNMHQDIHLLSILKQAPFYLDEKDLQEIRMAAPGRVPFYEAFERCMIEETPLGEKCVSIYHQIEEWQLLAGTMKASEFIWRLLRETGFYAICGAYPDGRLRQNNLDMLYQKALDMEKRGIYRLSDFLSQIQSVIERGQKDSDSPVAGTDSDNCVRLMTMHKSKGLEFRTVILMNLSKNMRRSAGRDLLRIDIGQGDTDRPALGLYLPAVNLEKNTKRNTFGKTAFDRRAVRNEIAEQTRLMYVAMTRAMEKLIMIGTYKPDDTELWMEKNRVSRIWRTRSLLDMVMPAILKKTPLPPPGNTVKAGPWKLTVQRPERIIAADTAESGSFRERILKILDESDPELTQQWTKPAEPRYPLKTSVSSMVRSIGHDAYYRVEDMEETLEEKRKPEGTRVVPFLLNDTPGVPKFMEIRRPTASDRGVAAHRFLRLLAIEQFRDLSDESVMEKLQQQSAELLENGILSADESKLIDLSSISRFIRSEIGQRFVHAGRIYREWPFTYRISIDTGTIIQGVIDAAFLEDNEWILIDYKTDHDTEPKRFIPRHAQQMNWYREAIEHLTNKPVREMWLFSLKNGQAHLVPKMDMTQNHAESRSGREADE
ncbi:MAG: UvrD-helicase domain-containing protein [Clostridia bacterium]|nr:UvrD-helicase domain-containing protein [Clostridia bacterium]